MQSIAPCSLLRIHGRLVDYRYICQINSSDPCSKLDNQIDIVTSTFKGASVMIQFLARIVCTICPATERQVIYFPLFPNTAMSERGPRLKDKAERRGTSGSKAQTRVSRDVITSDNILISPLPHATAPSNLLCSKPPNPSQWPTSLHCPPFPRA